MNACERALPQLSSVVSVCDPFHSVAMVYKADIALFVEARSWKFERVRQEQIPMVIRPYPRSNEKSKKIKSGKSAQWKIRIKG
jgi:hypothetical protein